MAMKERHYQVRLSEDAYNRVKEWADQVGLSVKRCIEMFIMRQLVELEKKDSVTLEISKSTDGSKEPTISIK